ncbi:MAG: hypothetical protein AAF630_02565, partial [Cyanobacteria bacterium P01_C01_bin.38]
TLTLITVNKRIVKAINGLFVSSCKICSIRIFHWFPVSGWELLIVGSAIFLITGSQSLALTGSQSLAGNC